jgi:hypothetical protein
VVGAAAAGVTVGKASSNCSPAPKFVSSPVEVRVSLLRFGRLRVESLGVPVD